MLGHFHIITFAQIAAVFHIECVGRVLQMTKDIKLTTFTRGNNAHAGFRRFGNNFQFRNFFQITAPHFRMPTVRHHKHIVKPTEDGESLIDGMGLKYSKLFLFQQVLGYLIEMVEGSHSSPTQIERALHMRPGPIKDFIDFSPIVYILIRNCFYRRARYDHAIKLLLHQFLRVLVE